MFVIAAIAIHCDNAANEESIFALVAHVMLIAYHMCHIILYVTVSI